jgi:hypothetical protein
MGVGARRTAELRRKAHQALVRSFDIEERDSIAPLDEGSSDATSECTSSACDDGDSLRFGRTCHALPT